MLANSPSLTTDSRLFATPEEQIATILRVNEAVWKDRSVTETAIRAAGDPPACPLSDDTHLFCVSLLRETGDPLRTLRENYEVLVFIHEGRVWRWDGLVFTLEGVRLREGAIARPRGLRWGVAELGRTHKSKKVESVRLDIGLKIMGIGQELPAFGAMHPRWAISMDGDTIPLVDAPDLEVRAFAHPDYAFTCAPCLLFSRSIGDVELGFHAVGIESCVSHFGPGYFWGGRSAA